MVESILKNKRILAVDDEPDILDTLQEQLEEFDGLIFDKATDYDTGYNLLKSRTYDLVILDIMGVRGFELLNEAASSGFPAVMLTAHAFSREALKEAIEIGAWAYLPKEKISEIVPFLEEVLTLGYQSSWKLLFESFGGLFNASFGPDWQNKEKEFWKDAASGEYNPETVKSKK